MAVEEVFRSANDRIAEEARMLGFERRIPFLCECSDPTCFALIRLDADEYALVRNDAPGAITLPEHAPGAAKP